MAFQRQAISPEAQARLREMATEMRELLYGAAGCSEWGTKFRDIEGTGMSVGLELARLVMEQTVAVQAEQMPASALVVEGDDVRMARTASQPLDTEAGTVAWSEPQARLQRSRKASFPQRQALGLKVDEDLSPAIVEWLTYLGARQPSFRDAHEALDVLLQTKLSEKRVEFISVFTMLFRSSSVLACVVISIAKVSV